MKSNQKVGGGKFSTGNKMGSPKLRKIKPVKVDLKKECDFLWAELVKLKAGYKSEYSGKPGKQIGGESILNAHHLNGKANLRLRYELENGICLTNGEHLFIAHHAGRQEDFKAKVRQLRGDDIYDRLQVLKHGSFKMQLPLIKIWLQQEIEKIKREKGL